MGMLMARVAYLLLTSAALGLFLGCLVSILFRQFRDLHEGSVKPTLLLLLCNYVCYVLAESIDFSAICALFVCAVISGHYALHSMDEKAQSFAHDFAEAISYLAEAFVFGYFGLTSVYYIFEGKFSARLIFFYIVSLVLCRGVMVLTMALLMKAATRCRPLALSVAELVVITFAGTMRGTIAFALVLRETPPLGQRSHQESLVVSTVLGIVLVNCVLFGGFFPWLLCCLGVGTEAALSRQNTPGTPNTPLARRNMMHRRWRKFDDSYLKPWLRTERGRMNSGFTETSEVAQDGAMHSLQPIP